MSEPETDDEDLVPALQRWQDFGGVWRLVSLTASGASVALCRCDGGEEVQRLSSSHPATLAFLGAVARTVRASREIAASPEKIFELIAEPTHQPRWDGNDNLAAAPTGQRVRRPGDVFTMTTTRGSVRENHVVEFAEGRLIAWQPAEPGQEPPGHLWRWELEPIDVSRTRVTHTYDWNQLTDENRFPRARATTADKLRASLDRLATLAEGS